MLLLLLLQLLLLLLLSQPSLHEHLLVLMLL